MSRRYLTVHGGQAHVRVGGAGGPVLVLPDIPGSGVGPASLARDLAGSGAAVAVPDLIGAGGTTVDPAGAGDLAAQARLAAGVLDALGWGRVGVVGDGAGAAVALQLARAHPERVRSVAVLAAPYAGPEPVPAWDGVVDPHGAHLVSLWHELRDMSAFSPFWRAARSSRRRRPMPDPAVLQGLFADTLPHAPAHRSLAEAARTAWPALAEAARTAWPALAATVRFLDVAAPYDAAAVLAALGPLPGGVAAFPDPTEVAPYLYVDQPDGQLHVRTRRPEVAADLPILLLHANPGSAWGLEPLLAALGTDRLALAPDLPGHGRSDPLPPGQRDTATLAGSYLPRVVALLDALGLDRVDVYGTHTGAGLGVELAIAAPSRVRCLVLNGVPLFDDDPELVAAVLDRYFVDLTPDEHGSHLVRAWHVNRDTGLWWPWFDHRTEAIRDVEPYPAEAVHRVTADLMFALPAYAVAYRAGWTWPATRRLPLVKQSTLVGAAPTDPLGSMTPRALSLLPRATAASFGGPERIAATIRAFTRRVADG